MVGRERNTCCILTRACREFFEATGTDWGGCAGGCGCGGTRDRSQRCALPFVVRLKSPVEQIKRGSGGEEGGGKAAEAARSREEL